MIGLGNWVTITGLSRKIGYNKSQIKRFTKQIGRTYKICNILYEENTYQLFVGDNEYSYWAYDEVRKATKEEIKKAEMELIAGKI